MQQASLLTNLKVHHTGFFSVTGTGLTQEEVERQYDIGQAYFDLPLEEKGNPKYRCDFAKGNYFGYRAVCSQFLFNSSTKDALLTLSQGQREEDNGHHGPRQC